MTIQQDRRKLFNHLERSQGQEVLFENIDQEVDLEVTLLQDKEQETRIVIEDLIVTAETDEEGVFHFPLSRKL